MSLDQGPEQSLLGRATEYRSDYAPELLFPIPRQQKREELGLVASALPFSGEDVWNAYEISWLNPRGKPQVAIGCFHVPAASPCLIESKSLKLYLNSFNQSVFADIPAVEACIAADLTRAAGAPVGVVLQAVSACAGRDFTRPQGICLDEQDIEVRCYEPAPALLHAQRGSLREDELLYSHLLKSNCLVTGQPDWGSVYVRYSGAAIDQEALLRYVISFRQHNEFHEQCVERIYCDIMARCKPARLAVWARYTRRGGLDINPFRTSDAALEMTSVFDIRQ